ncbi:MAG: glycosyltransferase family 4 protein [Verrucomicrobiaceae bacterium]
MGSIEDKYPRVFLSCYACEPGKGSEPEVGWRVATGVAEYAEATVLTRENNREAIEQGCREIGGRLPDFIYYDLPEVFRRLKKKGILGIGSYYVLWQIGARWRFRREFEQFDLLHHVTFNGFQFPGLWGGVSPKVVLGPLGGGMTFPRAILKSLSGGRRKEWIRGLVVNSFRWNPAWIWNLLDADRVIAANHETADLLRQVRTDSVEVMLETGYEVSGEGGFSRSEGGACEVLWVGVLISRKCPVLAIEVIERAVSRGADVRMTMIGEGAMRGELEELVAEKGLEDRIQLIGRIPKEEVEERMASADVFLFTSMRDTSGNVLLEAMARELPLVVPNHQGAGLICSEEHAVMVEVGEKETFVEDASDGVLKLAADAGLRERMGRAGRLRLKENFSWGGYHSRMKRIYREVLER